MYDGIGETGDLRDIQNCPSWCDGGDHMACAPEEPGDGPPVHYTCIGNVGEYSRGLTYEVVVTRATTLYDDRGPVIGLAGRDFLYDEPYRARFTAASARSIAAMLVAAADRVELNP
jgi:hypothetical protein